MADDGRSQPPPVHPHIAPFPGGVRPADVREPRPMFQHPDGSWNHGEGFGANPVDSGGWHSFDDGSNLQWTDVHLYTAAPTEWVGWHEHTWQDELHPAGQSPQTMLRWVGYLRPSGISLQDHPEFGDPNSTTDPPWVDNAAFEVFAPDVAPQQGQQIIVVVALSGTLAFPGKLIDEGPPPVYVSYEWRLRYPGWYSPDGLMRPEKAQSAGGYADNFGPSTSAARSAPASSACGSTWGPCPSGPW